MTASTFDGTRRIVVIMAGTADAQPVREQRAELLKHGAALDDRDMVVFVALPDGKVEPVHGPAPASTEVRDFLKRNPPSPGRGFEVLPVGKDGGVKLRSERPVRAEDLFALVDTMPMRRQEMKR
ncbi:MAG: DUF4174 domain-containing protein [Alsobacter sp.]